jgi:hypothetical protein
MKAPCGSDTILPLLTAALLPGYRGGVFPGWAYNIGLTRRAFPVFTKICRVNSKATHGDLIFCPVQNPLSGGGHSPGECSHHVPADFGKNGKSLNECSDRDCIVLRASLEGGSRVPGGLSSPHSTHGAGGGTFLLFSFALAPQGLLWFQQIQGE